MIFGNMRKLTRSPPFFLICLFTFFSHSTAVDTLTPTLPLTDGETLVSSGGSFALGFFSPANSKNRYIGIWYNNIPIQTVVWVANRQNPIIDSTGSLTVDRDGTLIVAKQKNSTVLWSSGATRASNPIAQLLDDGNFVVREANNNDTKRFLWQSFDHPTDTLLPGMKLGLSRTMGMNWNLTSWKSNEDPSLGDYSIAIDVRGDPQITLWSGSIRKWRSGPWNGVKFTGLPEMMTFRLFDYIFVNNKEDVYYTYHLLNQSIITRLVVNQTGATQRLVWLDRTGTWSVFWYTPKGQCDGFNLCGPYGSCDPNGSPMCSCLQGFEPKLPQDWSLRDGSGGCVRKTGLDCRNGTDGFFKMSMALLPDTSEATVNMSMSLDECRAMCLINCSCTAYASAGVSGSGCIIWVSELLDLGVYLDGGQDLYVRLAKADLDSILRQSLKRRHAIIAIVVTVVLGTILLASIMCYIWRKKARTRGASSITDEDDLSLPLFDLATLAAATNNFSFENKLGEGGFGPVFKGKMGEGREIAVKRLSKTSVQGLDELKTEVMLIAKLQHRNLVQLLGCCIQGEERMLIYEYMPNKSLDAFLFDKERGVCLDWKIRHHIITGIARGLLYLHQDSRFRIIHRDLKASNILLDKEMNPKISDFGMARIFGDNDLEAKTKRVVGTYGYMSPEYAMDGIFSVKSDVFSFGVLVLEIISGEKNKSVYLSEPHVNLLGHAWSLWNEGRSWELVDPSIGQSLSMDEVMRCINVGLLCVQERPKDRPTMSSVVLMLSNNIESLPEPKQPGFVARTCLSDVISVSKKQELLHSLNGVTITMSIAR